MISIQVQSQFQWSKKEKVKQILNREDSTTWDMTNFKLDSISNVESKKKGGFFPSPKYDLVAKNSFDGLGYDGDFKGIKINGKQFVYLVFYIKKNLVNSNFVGKLKNDMFFVIVVSTDYIDTEKFSHMSANITSRNHPNYLAEGYFETCNNLINYKAFITGDRDSYAIINSRLFDLSMGETILIIPQKDTSLRSIQRFMPKVSKNEIHNSLKELLNEKSIKDLYTNSQSI